MIQPLKRADAATLAIEALVFVLGDGALRERFLTLSGLSPDDLRHRLEDESLLAAVLAFLAGHEPDLIACAQALARTPEQLMNACHLLQSPHDR